MHGHGDEYFISRICQGVRYLFQVRVFWNINLPVPSRDGSEIMRSVNMLSTWIFMQT
jgi:hypothetical protein